MMRLLSVKNIAIVVVLTILGVAVYQITVIINKAGERDFFEKANKALMHENNLKTDSVRIYRDSLEVVKVESLNALQMKQIKQSQIELFQPLVKELSDSCNSCNSRNVSLLRRLAKCEESLSKTPRKKWF